MSSESIIISDDLILGSYSKGLSNLSKLSNYSNKIDQNRLDSIEIDIHSSWFDLTMLCYLGQLLNNLRLNFNKVDVNFSKIKDNPRKIEILWNLKFWNLIGANTRDSSLNCTPDPWNYTYASIDPKDFKLKPTASIKPTNFTPLIHYLIRDKEVFIEDKVNDWETNLQNTFIYRYISDSDLIQSKEYLYLILWELLHNSIIHSEGSFCTFGGQIFLGKSSRILDDKIGKTEEEKRAFQVLVKQHNIEVTNSRLPLRSKWLKRNENNSFLLVPLVDNGIGIPSSIKNRNNKISKSDCELLEYAFTPTVSSVYNDTNQDLFEVHGLSQILELIKNYDGYLFLQSSRGMVEFTMDDGFKYHNVLEEKVLSQGTLFQILLPLNDERKVSSQIFIKEHPKVTTHLELNSNQRPLSNTFFIYEECGEDFKNTIKDRNNWPQIIANLLNKINNIENKIIYLDFTFLPRNRQFISYLLRTIKKRNMLKGIVVINASPTIMTILDSLRKLNSLAIDLVDDNEVVLLDEKFSTILSRGKAGYCLSLLIPFCSFDNRKMEFKIKWIGLSCIPDEFIEPFEFILNKLFYQPRKFTWDEIKLLLKPKFSSDNDLDELLSGFKTMCRCNSSLLCHNGFEVELKISEDILSRISIDSLKEKFERDILPIAKHIKKKGNEDNLYDLSWRKTDRFRLEYYQIWKILSSSFIDDKMNESRFIFRKKIVDLLIRIAYNELGEDIFYVDLIISITPSAGLLGRQVAEYFKFDFIEAPSIYDIDNPEWIPKLKQNSKILIVNDVLDTGFLTEIVIEKIRNEKASVLAVLALVKNKDTKVKLDSGIKVVYVSEISLGIPSGYQIERATKDNNKYYEIDPYTLDPVHPNSYINMKNELEVDNFRNKLDFLIKNGVIFWGHFVNNIHHYNIFFSLLHALKIEAISIELYQWINSNIEQIKSSFNSSNISIVYPYYSPIFHLISFLQKKGLKIHYIIAKPQALTNKRLGYVISKDDLICSLEHVVLLDDGIASGGTFSSLIEQLLENNIKSITTLIIFDRIGMHPRKHLRKVETYKNRDNEIVQFRFNSYFSVNLRTYYEDNCPCCLIIQNIQKINTRTGILEHLKEDIVKLIEPVNVSSSNCNLNIDYDVLGVSQIISFENAVFTDIPSFHNIEKSVSSTKRKTFARLDHLTTILSDQKLSRQYLDPNKLSEIIISLLTDSTVESKERIKFILNSTLWMNKEFVLYFACSILPKAYKIIVENQEKNLSEISLYFNEYPLEYGSILISLYNILTIKKNEYSKKTARDSLNNFLKGWLEIFKTTDSKVTSGSIYLFELVHAIYPILDETSIDEVYVAWYLTRNFLGSYSLHHESFSQRLEDFLIQLDYNNNEMAKRLMSPAMFKLFINYIKIVSFHFEVIDILSNEELDEIQDFYSEWYQTGYSERLSEVLKYKIQCDENSNSSKFGLLLKEITPEVSVVYQLALNDYKKIFPDFPIEVKFISKYTNNEIPTCFGQKKFLSKVLLNLFTNPTKFWLEFPKDRRPPKLQLTLEIEVSEIGNSVKFRVIDNAGFDITRLKSLLKKATGGLGAQKQQLNRWDCDLFPEKNGNNTIMTLATPNTKRKVR